MVLLKKQRNELAEIIGDLKIPASSVAFTNEEQVFSVHHAETGFAFQVKYNSDSPQLNYPYVVFTTPRNIVVGSPYFTGQVWDGVRDGFREWAVLLAEEIHEPDLWAEMLSDNAFLKEGTPILDEKFSALEVKALESRVELVEQQLSAMALPAEAKEAFNEIARELPKDAKLLTKKKMGELLTGQLVQQGIKWALTSEHMQAVWQAFKTFTQLFLNQ